MIRGKTPPPIRERPGSPAGAPVPSVEQGRGLPAAARSGLDQHGRSSCVRSVPVRAAAAAGVVALVVAGATACGASAGDDKTPDHKSFALQGRTLTVDSDDSALEIVAADSNKAGTVEVTRWFQGTVALGKDPEVTWSMKDDRLVLRMKCSGVVADCAAKHRIEVPRGISREGPGRRRQCAGPGFTRPLSIRTGDGSVRVTDSSGPLELHTGDGSIARGASPPAASPPAPATARSTSNSAPYRTGWRPAAATAP